ncbi:N-acetylmuramoyl-L-alanine amidase [Nocardia africana]
MTAKPAYTELDRMGNSCQSRNGNRPTLFILHTEEGGSSAENLAAYLNDPNHDASYHYTVRDGIVCDVVDTDLASWSVGDANSYSINLCFAGSRAAWSRDQWLQREGDIAIAAWLAVQDCQKYGIPTTVIAPPYRRANGITDHRYVTQVIGWGSHTDVGDGFPWDVFTSYVNGYTNQGDEVALEETFTNFKGEKVTLGTAIRYMDQYVNEIREQLGGPQPFKGWAQLGNKTVVDSLADAHSKIDRIAAAIEALAKKSA